MGPEEKKGSGWIPYRLSTEPTTRVLREEREKFANSPTSALIYIFHLSTLSISHATSCFRGLSFLGVCLRLEVESDYYSVS